MLKPYHVMNIIEDALQQLDGVISDPDENNECTLSEATVEAKGNGELILSFKEDVTSGEKPDVYRIKIGYVENEDKNRGVNMKAPQIEWIPFDKNNPPTNLSIEETFLIFLREDNYNDGQTWHYSVDVATPYGSYIDDFWDTENDWREGQRVEVLAYAEKPYYLKEDALVDYEREKK